MADAVQVEGVRELIRAFGRIDRDVQKELTGALRKIARGVAATAKAIAEQKGLHATGTLIRKITISVSGGQAYVRDTASRTSRKWPSGFPYPAVYEFGHNKERAFLEPALYRDQEQIVHGVEEMLDMLLARNFGTV